MQCAGDYDAIALEIMMQCTREYDAMRWRL